VRRSLGARRDKAKRFGDVLKGVLKTKRFYLKGKYGALADAWQHVAGEEIAARTRLISFEHGRVTIEVSDPVLRHELAGFMRAALLAELQKAPGAEDVVEMRFQLGQPGAQ